ncbi:MAG TPA: CoA-transferase [Syntrophomonas sp.]|nr:CoA-transferase [Syntrophomonas sp.]
MKYAENYSSSEMMAAVCARQIRNDDVAFVGVGIPLMAGAVASATHAPDVILAYEAGGVGAKTRRMPWTISDSPTTDNALVGGSMNSIFSDLQRGFVTVGIIGGAEVDKYGNLNTTAIFGANGSYEHPQVRLPGSGGANDIASSAPRTVIVMRLQKGKFVNKIDFNTSPGHLTGYDSRKKAGLVGGGPAAVVTDRGLFKFDEVTKEMYLDTLYPGQTVDQIKELIDWDLKVSSQLNEAEPPTEEQISIMHDLDPLGTVLGSKSMKGKAEPFDNYYESLKKGYSSTKLVL